MTHHQQEQAAWNTWQAAEDRAARTWASETASAQQKWMANNEARCARTQWDDAADRVVEARR